MTNSYLPVKSAIRCLEVLVAVNRLETNATVGEIHRLVNIEKPTIVRMLETLTFLGFLAKDEKTLSYAPTGKTLSLSAGYKKHKLFSALISPLLKEFNRIIGWPVNIGIYDYDSMLIIETKKESGQVSFGRTFEVGIGTRAPMLGSSLGLAYFAFTTQTERNKITSLINKTKKDAWNLITKDINLRVKCDSIGIKADDYYADYEFIESENLYSGHQEFIVDPDVINKAYSGNHLKLSGI